MFNFPRKISDEKKQARIRNRRVHLANERTFLAWIRTSLGIMAFGFVIEKLLDPRENRGDRSLALLGIFIVILGAAAALLSTYRFLKIEKDISDDTFRPSMAADVLLALLLGSIGGLLVIYMISAF